MVCCHVCVFLSNIKHFSRKEGGFKKTFSIFFVVVSNLTKGDKIQLNRTDF